MKVIRSNLASTHHTSLAVAIPKPMQIPRMATTARPIQSGAAPGIFAGVTQFNLRSEQLNARYGSNPAFVAIDIAGPVGASDEMIFPTT
jgi:hypothetical protein